MKIQVRTRQREDGRWNARVLRMDRPEELGLIGGGYGYVTEQEAIDAGLQCTKTYPKADTNRYELVQE